MMKNAIVVYWSINDQNLLTVVATSSLDKKKTNLQISDLKPPSTQLYTYSSK